MFLDDLTELLTDKIPKLSNTIIMGEFNINTEDISNFDTVIFNDTMWAFGSSQDVTKPIHQEDNILDLFFTEENSDTQVVNYKTYTCTADHCL